MSEGQIVDFLLAPEVLAAQVKLIADALDVAGIGSDGLVLEQVAGEVIRRNVFGELGALGVEFGGGCGWSFHQTGGIVLTINVIHDRDLLVVKSVVADLAPQ